LAILLNDINIPMFDYSSTFTLKGGGITPAHCCRLSILMMMFRPHH